MEARYRKSVETRRKNAKGNPYAEMGKKGGAKSKRVTTTEQAQAAANARWKKRKMELIGLDDAYDIKEELKGGM